MASLGFSVHRIMASANSDSFVSFQFRCLLFLFLPWILWLGLPINITLNKSGERCYPCLIPILRGKTFSFSPFSMFSMGLSYMASIMLNYVPSIATFLIVFVIDGYWILSKAFSASIEMIIWLLSFICWCGASH